MFVIEQLAVAEAPVAGFVVHDRDIELRIEEGCKRIQGVLRNDLQDERRIATSQPFDERRQPRVTGVAVRADAQLAAGVPGQLFDLRFDAADCRQHLVGGIDDEPACCGRQHPPSGTNEDGRAELSFNLTQLVADSGLRHAEAIGGARDAFRAGDFHDQPEVTRVEEFAHE